MVKIDDKWSNVLLLACLSFLITGGYIHAQIIERWVYTYNGTGDGADQAHSVVYGEQGKIYAAGVSVGDATNRDFTVIALDTLGNKKGDWIVDGGALSVDAASSIVCDADGYLYVAGSIVYDMNNREFAAVSLEDTDTTLLMRWTYMYDGDGSDFDSAQCLAYGKDGNVYVAGTSTGSGTGQDIILISLTSEGISGNGVVNWCYTYNGNASLGDKANAIVYGIDGNIYVAGQSIESDYDKDFTVISIDTTGTENWFLTYDGTAGSEDKANAIVYGEDGNLYVAGQTRNTGTSYDFTVMSVDPTAGDINWVYNYDVSNSTDIANAIVYGADGYIYAAGYSTADTIQKKNFTVIKLDNLGNQQSVYTYNGPGNNHDEAKSVIYGEDGYIYAAGYIRNYSSNMEDFTVIKLNDLFTDYEIYTYNGSASNNDRAYSVVYGDDGNIYVAGYSTNEVSGQDFTVISITQPTGIEDNSSDEVAHDTYELFPSLFNKEINLRFTRSSDTPCKIALYNVLGIRVYENSILSKSSLITLNDRGITRLPHGVYFLSITHGEYFYPIRKVIKY